VVVQRTVFNHENACFMKRKAVSTSTETAADAGRRTLRILRKAVGHGQATGPSANNDIIITGFQVRNMIDDDCVLSDVKGRTASLGGQHQWQ
jgi:hypothetical protein